jgi:REase_DpnII-MboI
MECRKSVEELQELLETIDEINTRGVLSDRLKIWHSKTLAVLKETFGLDSEYVKRFEHITYLPSHENSRTPELLKTKAFKSGLEQAKSLISECLRTLNSNYHVLNDLQQNAIQFIEGLCNRFPRIAKHICTEYRGKKVANIEDEYDVQHLFHTLLLAKFDDIRPEDVNSSYAGATSRVDFLLKQEQIVIEVKKTRGHLKDKEIGEQLIIDMKRYSQNQNCKILICFVYDPDHLIKNPSGLESDLSGSHDGLEVKVIISPKN